MSFALGLTLAQSAHANLVSNEEYVAVCKAAKEGDLREFKKAVKNTHIKLRNLYPGFECNGVELLGFAMMGNGQDDVADYIIKHTKRRDIAVIEGGDAIEWFINKGYEDTSAYDKLKKKIG